MSLSSKQVALICLGWFFVILGIIGIILPILPTTPFLILAMFIFSKSSPKFYQMLVNNSVIGPELRDWRDHRRIARKSKYKAYILILITFSISIYLIEFLALRIILIICLILLIGFLHSIKET